MTEENSNNDRHKQRQQRLKEQVDARIEAAQERRGILIVFTGNGKGKTTAAFGTVSGLALSSSSKVNGQMVRKICWSRMASNFR